MSEKISTYDSACASCGTDIQVTQYESEDIEKATFEGGCFLSAFSPNHDLNTHDDRPGFYHECEDCCPHCDDE